MNPVLVRCQHGLHERVDHLREGCVDHAVGEEQGDRTGIDGVKITRTTSPQAFCRCRATARPCDRRMVTDGAPCGHTCERT